MAEKAVNLADDGAKTKSTNTAKALTEAQKKYYQEKIDKLIINNSNGPIPQTGQEQATAILEEQARKKRIQNYKELIRNVSSASSKVAGYCEELEELKILVVQNFTGNEANELLASINGIYTNCETALNRLNTVGNKAVQQIRSEGESFQYSKTVVSHKNTDKTKNTQSFKCNTDMLRKYILPTLSKLEKDFNATSNEISGFKSLNGCESINQIPDHIKNAKKQVSNAYNKTLKFINDVEKAEEENLNVLEKAFNWIKGIFNTKEKETEKKEAQTFLTTNNTLIKEQNEKLAIDILEEKYGIEKDGKSFSQVANEAGVIKIAQENGIDTKNKPFEEILNNVAEKMGIPTTITSQKENQIETIKTNTFDDFFEYAKETKGNDNLLKDEKLLEGKNYNFDGRYYWEEAFKSVGQYENGKLVQDLNNGKQLIWTNKGKTYLITDYSDGNVTVQNTKDNSIETIGLEKFASIGGTYYSYSLKEPKTTKTTTVETVVTGRKQEEILKDVLEGFGLPYSSDKYEFEDTRLPGLKDWLNMGNNLFPNVYEEFWKDKPKKSEDMEETEIKIDSSNFGLDITYTQENFSHNGILGKLLSPSTNESTKKTLTIVIPGQDPTGMDTAVFNATQSGDLTYNGYTLVLSNGWGTPENLVEAIKQLCEERNIDIENVELVGFSEGAANAIGLTSSVEKMDGDFHFKKTTVISGGTCQISDLEEIIQKGNTELEGYVGESGDGAYEFMTGTISKYIHVNVIEGNHTVDKGGIVENYFTNYAHSKQELNTSQEEPKEEVVENATLESTTNVTKSYPRLNQLEFGNIPFGSSNMKSAGCGPTSLCMLASAAKGKTYTPENLMNDYNEKYNIDGYYNENSGGGDGLIQNQELLGELGLKFEEKYTWNDAFSNGKLVEDLKNGKPIIWRTDNTNGNNPFTKGGHYLLITGITEDNKLIINDPNGENWEKNGLKNGFENGFDINTIKGQNGDFYSYSFTEES